MLLSNSVNLWPYIFSSEQHGLDKLLSETISRASILTVFCLSFCAPVICKLVSFKLHSLGSLKEILYMHHYNEKE